MRFPIRPGKVACAGIVAILMVLPNSIWKGADANANVPTARPKVQKVQKKTDSSRLGVKLRKVPR
jgi:hypothetical protein